MILSWLLCLGNLGFLRAAALSSSEREGFAPGTLEVPRRRCLSSEMRCPSGLCISGRFRCDGLNDCGDGFDEHNCEKSQRLSLGTGVGFMPSFDSAGTGPNPYIRGPLSREPLNRLNGRNSAEESISELLACMIPGVRDFLCRRERERGLWASPHRATETGEDGAFVGLRSGQGFPALDALGLPFLAGPVGANSGARIRPQGLDVGHSQHLLGLANRNRGASVDFDLRDAGEMPIGVEAVVGDRTNFLGTLLGVGETKGFKFDPETWGTTLKRVKTFFPGVDQTEQVVLDPTNWRIGKENKLCLLQFCINSGPGVLDLSPIAAQVRDAFIELRRLAAEKERLAKEDAKSKPSPPPVAGKESSEELKKRLSASETSVSELATFLHVLHKLDIGKEKEPLFDQASLMGRLLALLDEKEKTSKATVVAVTTAVPTQFLTISLPSEYSFPRPVTTTTASTTTTTTTHIPPIPSTAKEPETTLSPVPKLMWRVSVTPPSDKIELYAVPTTPLEPVTTAGDKIANVLHFDVPQNFLRSQIPRANFQQFRPPVQPAPQSRRIVPAINLRVPQTPTGHRIPKVPLRAQIGQGFAQVPLQARPGQPISHFSNSAQGRPIPQGVQRFQQLPSQARTRQHITQVASQAQRPRVPQVHTQAHQRPPPPQNVVHVDPFNNPNLPQLESPVVNPAASLPSAPWLPPPANPSPVFAQARFSPTRPSPTIPMSEWSDWPPTPPFGPTPRPLPRAPGPPTPPSSLARAQSNPLPTLPPPGYDLQRIPLVTATLPPLPQPATFYPIPVRHNGPQRPWQPKEANRWRPHEEKPPNLSWATLPPPPIFPTPRHRIIKVEKWIRRLLPDEVLPALIPAPLPPTPQPPVRATTDFLDFLESLNAAARQPTAAVIRKTRKEAHLPPALRVHAGFFGEAAFHRPLSKLVTKLGPERTLPMDRRLILRSDMESLGSHSRELGHEDFEREMEPVDGGLFEPFDGEGERFLTTAAPPVATTSDLMDFLDSLSSEERISFLEDLESDEMEALAMGTFSTPLGNESHVQSKPYLQGKDFSVYRLSPVIRPPLNSTLDLES